MKELLVPAWNVKAGDMYLDHGEWRDVVRFYPRGRSGNASFCEISFGSTCVSVPPSAFVLVRR